MYNIDNNLLRTIKNNSYLKQYLLIVSVQAMVILIKSNNISPHYGNDMVSKRVRFKFISFQIIL